MSKSAMALVLLLFANVGNAVEVVPVEFTGPLQTPGIGFQTFYKFADEDANTTDHYPTTGSAYIRYYWELLEPTEGQYNFAMIDNHLARARANNQTLDFRIMLMDDVENRIPQWLKDKNLPNVSGTNFLDLENPVLRAAHDDLIRAIGERYDDHPDLGSIDIGSVGFWGEWHTYLAPDAMPSVATQKSIVDLYHEVFPNTPLVANIDAWNEVDGNSTVLKYTTGLGRTGWRGDSWGDALDDGWNHHDDIYTPAEATIPTAWQNGPVAMEPGEPNGTMPFDSSITRAVDDAIAWHASLVHNKSAVIPTEYLPELDRLVNQLGFRMVLRRAVFDDVFSLTEPNTIDLEWENLGIAPPYRDHRIAFRLVDAAGQLKAVVTTEQSIRGWLPGDKDVSVDYIIPGNAGLVPGETYFLELALVFHSAIDRLVPIAMDGGTADGWYRLTSIEAATGLQGDYNNDGKVDAADYTVWRDNVGTEVSLPNDLTPGVDQSDHDVWKNNFGASLPDPADGAALPEPTGLGLIGFVLALSGYVRAFC